MMPRIKPLIIDPLRGFLSDDQLYQLQGMMEAKGIPWQDYLDVMARQGYELRGEWIGERWPVKIWRWVKLPDRKRERENDAQHDA